MNTPPAAEAMKRAAAARALEFVEDGMKIGLGTGSTADAFLDLLAPLVHAGLKIVGTPTSQRTADKARALGIPIEELDMLGPLDLVVDGADEADGDLNLIKGGGGGASARKNCRCVRPADAGHRQRNQASGPARRFRFAG